MHELSAIDVKRPLIGFVCNSVSHFLSEHHLVAAHVIVHHVFQLRHEGLFVDDIKVNQIFGRHLNSDISFDIVDKASHLDGVEKLPLLFLRHDVNHLLKEIDVSGASNDQTLTSKQDHLSQVFFRNLLHREFAWFIWINKKCLALPVK